MDIPISQLNVSSYENKKKELKYQLVATPDIFRRLLEGDPEVIAAVKAKVNL